MMRSILLALWAQGLLAGQVTAEQHLKIPSKVENSSYSAELDAYLSVPRGQGPFPAVIMMHGCSGLGKATRQGFALHGRYLRERGFATLTLDSFSARGKLNEEVCIDQNEGMAAIHYRQMDAFHALNYLQSLSSIQADNIFLLGKSHGGSVALYASAGADEINFPDQPLFRAVVAYYPECQAVPTWPMSLQSPLLVLAGAADNWQPPGACLSAKDKVRGAAYDVEVYEQAHHAFDMPIGRIQFGPFTLEGHPEAAEKSRRRMADWFISHLK